MIAENQHKQSLLELARNLGMSPATPLEIAEPLDYHPLKQPEIDALAPAAMLARADYLSLLSQRAGIGRAAARQPRPLVSEVERQRELRRDWAQHRQRASTGLVQGQIDFTLFDRDRNGEAQELASRVKRIDDQIADLRRGIEEDLREALLNLDSAAEQVAVAREGQELARRELQMAQDRFQAGTANNVEVVTAQDELARAEENCILAVSATWTRSLPWPAPWAIRKRTLSNSWEIDKRLLKAGARDRKLRMTRFEAMKRIIPVLILLAVAIAAGVYYYPRLTKKDRRPPINLRSPATSKRMRAWSASRCRGASSNCPSRRASRWSRARCWRAWMTPTYKQRVRIDEAARAACANRISRSHLAGTRHQEVKAAQQTMIDAEADLEQKKLDNDRAQQLFAKDEVSAQERDQAATALKRAEAIFKAAQQRYNEAVEGSRKEDIAIARANLNEASANLGLSRVNLSYTILRAPSAGVVTVREAELGEVVAPGSPVVTLADLDHIWLRAYIAETDLGRIHWGQEAAITTDTYPGKQYHGRISFISSDAEFTPKSVQTTKERVTLVYRIKIDIDNPNHELKPGMPADAHIELALRSSRAAIGGAAKQ